MESKNHIMVDCVCDLPKEFIEENNIGVIGFYLSLETGRFMDGYEISATNVIEYYDEKKKMIVSNPPSPEEYAQTYRKKLENAENIIHFTISSCISDSYKSATAGRDLLAEEGERVFIVDTKILSSGMGYYVIKALEMAKQNKSANEIAKACEELHKKLDVSFVSHNADHLAINGRVSEPVAKFFRTVKLHPKFEIKEGKLTVDGFGLGSREGTIRRYIRKKLKKPDCIDCDTAFITHAACSVEEVELIVAEIKKRIDFKNIYVCKTSATVTCNCGAGTFGMMFMYK